MNEIGYATGKNPGSTEQDFILSYSTHPALTKRLEILKDAIRATLHRLTVAGKQVVFIFNVPVLDFDPATCVYLRPWRITPVHLKSPCTMPQKEVDASGSEYRKMVMMILQEFPKVKIWDSFREMCDGVNCRAMKDDVLLYRDQVHLSEEGSLYMGERLPLQDMRETSGQ
jgi:hypothetical protein